MMTSTYNKPSFMLINQSLVHKYATMWQLCLHFKCTIHHVVFFNNARQWYADRHHSPSI